MNGIICIYKEKGMTSFDVVAKVRRIYKTKKVGHGGTLDPMAEGVLPVFVGDATKAADFCPDDTKQYVAGFQFGITTDTQDITGKVLSTCDAYVSRNKMPMIERIFTGEQLQTPPMYSAVKVNGQRLYDLARKGEVVNRQPRKINIYELKVQKYEYNSGEMSVTCSKGTYIRTLIHDIGQKLETGAVMTSLVRVRSGVFTLENCYRLSELEGKDEGELEALLMPLEKLYGQLPKARLDEKQTKLFRNGATLDADRIRFDIIYDKGYYIEGADGVFLGLGKIGEKHELEVLRRFNTDSSNVMKAVEGGNNYAKIKTAAERKAEKAAEEAAETVEETAEAKAEEPAAEAAKETAEAVIEEAAAETVKEITQTVAEESIAETVEENMESVAEEPISEVVEETSEAKAEEPTAEAAKEAAVELVEDIAEAAVEETVAKKIEEKTESVVEESVAEVIEEPAETPTEEAITEVVEETTEAASEETAAETIEENTESVVEEPIAEVIEETAEAVTEESVTEVVEDTTETAIEKAVTEAVEDTTETSAEEAITEVVEETTEAAAEETAAETIEEKTESVVEEPIAEVIEETAETVIEESVTEVIEETTEPLSEAPFPKTALESAETGEQGGSEEKGGENEKTAPAEAETMPPKQIISERQEKSEEDGEEEIYIPTIGSLPPEFGGEQESIVARALANIKAANGEGAEETLGGGDAADKSLDIVEQAVARVTYDSDLENIFSESSPDKNAENKRADIEKEGKETENKTESRGGKIDDDYLAYLESAFIDDDEDFFDGERTEGI